jgi:hypothetical protein
MAGRVRYSISARPPPTPGTPSLPMGDESDSTAEADPAADPPSHPIALR